jgi:hypothetical protein
LNDFNDEDQAWMIRDAISGARLNIPDKQYPGTEVVRLFLSEVDAKTVIEKTKAAGSTRIGNSVLVAVQVPLLMTIREIVDLRKAGTDIGFVVHSPNEVYEFE